MKNLTLKPTPILMYLICRLKEYSNTEKTSEIFGNALIYAANTITDWSDIFATVNAPSFINETKSTESEADEADAPRVLHLMLSDNDEKLYLHIAEQIRKQGVTARPHHQGVVKAILFAHYHSYLHPEESFAAPLSKPAAAETDNSFSSLSLEEKLELINAKIDFMTRLIQSLRSNQL